MEFSKIISQNFLCSGRPVQVANRSVQALDISTGKLYAQQKIPYGTEWKEIDQYYFQTISDGGIESVETSGLVTIDNTDPLNPVIGFNADASDAIINANSPDSSNPFATINDISGAGVQSVSGCGCLWIESNVYRNGLLDDYLATNYHDRFGVGVVTIIHRL